MPDANPAQDVHVSQPSAGVRAHARVVPVYLILGELVERLVTARWQTGELRLEVGARS